MHVLCDYNWAIILIFADINNRYNEVIKCNISVIFWDTVSMEMHMTTTWQMQSWMITVGDAGYQYH